MDNWKNKSDVFNFSPVNIHNGVDEVFCGILWWGEGDKGGDLGGERR